MNAKSSDLAQMVSDLNTCMQVKEREEHNTYPWSWTAVLWKWLPEIVATIENYCRMLRATEPPLKNAKSVPVQCIELQVRDGVARVFVTVSGERITLISEPVSDCWAHGVTAAGIYDAFVKIREDAGQSGGEQ